MARQPASRLQLSGYRFLIRRTEHALVRGDARMLDDPLRAQSISLAAGCLLAVIAVVACVVLAVLRPDGALGSAPILMTRTSGALHVRIGDTIHPVLNLASARLIAGTPADPKPVGDAVIAAAKRGPLVGIPGAPTQIDPALSIEESGWTVCDVSDPPATVLVVGRRGGDTRPQRPGQAMLVRPRGESAATTYLLFDGRRAVVDLRDMAVVRALRLEGVAPRDVSRALLDTVPEVPAIRAPVIADAGAPGPPALGGLTIGSVVRVIRADLGGAEFYVVLGAGLQRIGAVAADLIRFTVAQPRSEPVTVAADALVDVPFVETLPVAAFPAGVRQPAGAVVCAGWDVRQAGPDTNTTLLVGDSLPQEALTLAQADESGPNIDRVLIPAGRSALVRSAAVTGDDGTPGSLYLVNDLGVRFGIHDDEVATRLGLTAAAVPAPWPMLASLPRGPELSTAAASVVGDSPS
ncbi:type VII secretion protein EccB [Mycobacterium sp. 21AC1]|uniref:type VII secretion protein EccB n=1 Tax=[Mycobacterium] appelbergii TaxID=2939269 RepID=UPI002938EEB7|nr:type VII secretion protein EccB [Mycobacterium sp. 21AC1]MDV3127478.1 type VII secretion protein EccB [Mycobacterium sp. 21AC1]